jgi:hypothetical protein
VLCRAEAASATAADAPTWEALRVRASCAFGLELWRERMHVEMQSHFAHIFRLLVQPLL